LCNTKCSSRWVGTVYFLFHLRLYIGFVMLTLYCLCTIICLLCHFIWPLYCLWLDLRLVITPFVSSGLSWIFYTFIFFKKIEDVQFITHSHKSFLPIINMLLTQWGEIEGLMSIQCLFSSTCTRKSQFKKKSKINCFLFSILSIIFCTFS